MAKLTTPGRYKGYVTAHAIKRQENGCIVYEAQCEMLRQWNGQEKREVELKEPITARAFLTIVKKDGGHVEAHLGNLKDCYGWDGVSLKALQGIDPSKTEVSFDVKPNDGDNKEEYPVKVAFINKAGGSVKATGADELDAIDAIFAGKKPAETEAF